jgi:hypothetical protein
MTDWAIAGRRARPLAAAALLAALTGCGLFGESNEVIATCPPSGVLAEGELLERYRPNSERDLTDLEFRAKIGDLRPVCSFLQKEQRLEMDLAMRVLAERGPAGASDKPIELSYFVAVVDDDQRVHQRQAFPLAVAFEGSARQASFSEQLFIAIPLAPGTTVRNYRVVVSLQLGEEEFQRAIQQRDQRSRPAAPRR